MLNAYFVVSVEKESLSIQLKCHYQTCCLLCLVMWCCMSIPMAIVIFNYLQYLIVLSCSDNSIFFMSWLILCEPLETKFSS